ncbi:MAG: hypothetical protein WC492_04105 [Candidatus Micrarchaeia archaeon]
MNVKALVSLLLALSINNALPNGTIFAQAKQKSDAQKSAYSSLQNQSSSAKSILLRQAPSKKGQASEQNGEQKTSDPYLRLLLYRQQNLSNSSSWPVLINGGKNAFETFFAMDEELLIIPPRATEKKERTIRLFMQNIPVAYESKAELNGVYSAESWSIRFLPLAGQRQIQRRYRPSTQSKEEIIQNMYSFGKLAFSRVLEPAIKSALLILPGAESKIDFSGMCSELANGLDALEGQPTLAPAAKTLARKVVSDYGFNEEITNAICKSYDKYIDNMKIVGTATNTGLPNVYRRANNLILADSIAGFSSDILGIKHTQARLYLDETSNPSELAVQLELLSSEIVRLSKNHNHPYALKLQKISQDFKSNTAQAFIALSQVQQEITHQDDDVLNALDIFHAYTLQIPDYNLFVQSVVWPDRVLESQKYSFGSKSQLQIDYPIDYYISEFGMDNLPDPLISQNELYKRLKLAQDEDVCSSSLERKVYLPSVAKAYPISIWHTKFTEPSDTSKWEKFELGLNATFNVLSSAEPAQIASINGMVKIGGRSRIRISDTSQVVKSYAQVPPAPSAPPKVDFLQIASVEKKPFPSFFDSPDFSLAFSPKTYNSKLGTTDTLFVNPSGLAPGAVKNLVESARRCGIGLAFSDNENRLRIVAGYSPGALLSYTGLVQTARGSFTILADAMKRIPLVSSDTSIYSLNLNGGVGCLLPATLRASIIENENFTTATIVNSSDLFSASHLLWFLDADLKMVRVASDSSFRVIFTTSAAADNWMEASGQDASITYGFSTCAWLEPIQQIRFENLSWTPNGGVVYSYSLGQFLQLCMQNRFVLEGTNEFSVLLENGWRHSNLSLKSFGSWYKHGHNLNPYMDITAKYSKSESFDIALQVSWDKLSGFMQSNKSFDLYRASLHMMFRVHIENLW